VTSQILATGPQIVACPACGKANRVRKQNLRGRFKCGACHGDLPNPFSLIRRLTSLAALVIPSKQTRRRIRMPLIVGVSVVAAVLLLIWVSPKPAAPLPPPRRLANGTIIAGLHLDGNGTLEIDNGTANDAVIKVVDQRTHRALEACYILAERKVSIGHVPDGEILVYFASGSDFDSSLGGFTRDKGFSKFVDALAFTTEVLPTADGINTQSTTFTLTLHPVANGNAKTSAVDEAEFLRL
jgi:hypothetical protein